MKNNFTILHSIRVPRYWGRTVVPDMEYYIGCGTVHNCKNVLLTGSIKMWLWKKDSEHLYCANGGYLTAIKVENPCEWVYSVRNGTNFKIRMQQGKCITYRYFVFWQIESQYLFWQPSALSLIGMHQNVMAFFWSRRRRTLIIIYFVKWRKR